LRRSVEANRNYPIAHPLSCRCIGAPR
jgi:hypothetical protein